MKTSTATPRADLYTRVTEHVIADLEAGVRPWTKPWDTADTYGIGLPVRHNGLAYRGVNILILWGEALGKGYSSPVWMTFKQALALSGSVRKGEHGSIVVYADRFTRIETDVNGNDVEREIPFLKAYTVFNVAQIDGLAAEYYANSERRTDKLQLIEAAERFFAATAAVVRHGGDAAYYAPGLDVIQLPWPEAFRDAESYAATKAHELTHWTSHPQRLARDFGAKRFGDTGYAREELVAEIGAAFLCAQLQITAEPRHDHASYIAHWLQLLREDKRAIFTAAAHAQRAVDFLHGLQRVQIKSALATAQHTPSGCLPPFSMLPSAPSALGQRTTDSRGAKHRARSIRPHLARVCRKSPAAEQQSRNDSDLGLFWLDPRAGVRGPARKV
jgi:antirestriction protein ArdC